jgi:hypothetical protein
MSFDEERQDGGDVPSSCQRWSMKYLRLPRLTKMAVFLLLVVDLTIVGVLLYTLEPLITLLRRNEELFTPTVTLPLNETASASYYSGDLGRQKIPRILHQTTANSTIPDKWIKSQQSCVDTYSDFEYKVSLDTTGPDRVPNGEKAWFSANCAFSFTRHVCRLFAIVANWNSLSCGPTSRLATSSLPNILGL